jgi:hypothetical protein
MGATPARSVIPAYAVTRRRCDGRGTKTERLARITPDDMTGEQAEIYAKFTGGKRAGAAFSLVHPEGGLVGPPNAWLLSPPLARVFERTTSTSLGPDPARASSLAARELRLPLGFAAARRHPKEQS